MEARVRLPGDIVERIRRTDRDSDIHECMHPHVRSGKCWCTPELIEFNPHTLVATWRHRDSN